MSPPAALKRWRMASMVSSHARAASAAILLPVRALPLLNTSATRSRVICGFWASKRNINALRPAPAPCPLPAASISGISVDRVCRRMASMYRLVCSTTPASAWCRLPPRACASVMVCSMLAAFNAWRCTFATLRAASACTSCMAACAASSVRWSALLLCHCGSVLASRRAVARSRSSIPLICAPESGRPAAAVTAAIQLGLIAIC